MPTVDPNLPYIALDVFPPGGSETNLANFLAWEGTSTTNTVMSNFGRQGDTATLVLVDDYSTNHGNPNFHIPPFTTVRLRDVNPAVQAQPAQGVIFTGLVNNPQFRWISGGGPKVEWILNCTDFTYYADNAVLQGEYVGQTADTIMIDITKKSGSGLLAASVANGGHVYPGPVIPISNLAYDTLSNHWTNISKLASQNAVYGWFVDSTYNLWFYDQTRSFSSGVAVTDTPSQTTPTSVNECHIDLNQPMQYEWDGSTFYTRCIVEGANTTHTFDLAKAKKGTIAPTDSWKSTGVQPSWPLSYAPDLSGGTSSKTSSSFFLKVNGKATAVTYYDGSTAVTDPFEMVQATNGLWTLQVTPGYGSIPPAGVVLQFWYKYQAPVIGRADLVQQQRNIGGPNNGVFAEFINDSSLTTTGAALSRATAQLEEYGAPQERLTFYTSPEWIGWFRCGQTFGLHSRYLPESKNHYAPGINGVFFVMQQNVSFKPGGYRTTQVTAVRIA